MIFKIAQKVVPEISIDNEYYDKYIAVWKEIYKGYYEDWHKVTTNNGSRTMASMQVAKLICSEMSSLVFTEKIEISIDKKEIDKYVKDVFKENAFMTNQSELIEYCFALGGSINKIRRKDNKTVIDYLPADNFFPITWSNSKITEGVFISSFNKQKDVYILAEKHELKEVAVTEATETTEAITATSAIVTYKLFKQKQNNAEGEGVEVPVTNLFPDLKDFSIQNVEQPLFSYMKPNIGNNINMNTPLGMSMFGNSLDTLKSLDICFDSLQREFTLGRKRIIVPSSALRNVTDPISGQIYRYFDDETDVYEGLNFDDSDGLKIQDDTQELRVEEHVSALNAFLNILCVQVGVSQGFVSFDVNGGLKTATEVISENSKTFRTKVKQEEAIKKNIEELIAMIVEVGVLHEDIKQVDYNVELKFDDSIIEDNNAEEMKDQGKVLSGLMAKWEYRVKWFNQTEAEAKAFVKELEPKEVGV